MRWQNASRAASRGDDGTADDSALGLQRPQPGDDDGESRRCCVIRAVPGVDCVCVTVSCDDVCCPLSGEEAARRYKRLPFSPRRTQIIANGGLTWMERRHIQR
jgi:hypothetical protein